MSPRSTLVIPLRSQKDDFLAVCLASAVAQSVSCEILIVISEDTPRSNLDIVSGYESRWPNVHKLMRRRAGFAAAINTGFDAASTSRIGLLLTDDWLHSCAFEQCLAVDADIVSSDLAVYDETGLTNLGLRRPRTQSGYEKLHSFHDKASYLGHFMLFRRAPLMAIGGVDETVGNVGPDDFDLLWCLLERGASVAVVEQTLYCYRDHPGERLTLRPRADQMRDLEKIFDKHGVVGPEREQLIARHARWFGRTLLDVVSSSKPRHGADDAP